MQNGPLHPHCGLEIRKIMAQTFPVQHQVDTHSRSGKGRRGKGMGGERRPGGMTREGEGEGKGRDEEKGKGKGREGT